MAVRPYHAGGRTVSEQVNGPVAPGDLFAFYGLLKKGAAGMPEHINLEAAGAFLGACRFRGSMYDVGYFPGVIDGPTLCFGVRYRIDDPSIMSALDDFEDVLADDIERSLYVRKRVDLLDSSGAPTGERAWIYWYNQPVDEHPHLPDGDWPLTAGRARQTTR